ncbi:MAG: mechanosensitive ion channel family protein [Candidatus Neomarinimicrobiota bacterium]
MLSQLEGVTKYLIPSGIILGSLILGWLFRTYVHRRLITLAQRTRWRGDDIILKAVQSSVLLWLLLGGFYLAMENSPLSPQLVRTLQTVVATLIILSVTLAVSRIAVGLLQLYSESTGGALPSTSMFANLARIIVIAIGFLILFQTLGVSITPLLTALGIGGLAISLALKDTLSDFFAGLHILLSGKLKPGDIVALESGERGTVENISWRDTNIRDREDNLIIIPNSRVSTALITNFDVPAKEMAVRVICGISYDSDLEHAERVTLDVAKEVMENVPGGVPGSEPGMRFTSFGESSIDFRVSLRATDYAGRHAVVHEFIKRLHTRFKEEGINIPFPIRTIYQQNAK